MTEQLNTNTHRHQVTMFAFLYFFILLGASRYSSNLDFFLYDSVSVHICLESMIAVRKAV